MKTPSLLLFLLTNTIQYDPCNLRCRARPHRASHRGARAIVAMRVLNDDSRATVVVAEASSSSAPPLLITPAAAAAAAAGAAAGTGSDAAGFDSDMVIILAALLCVLVCALGLNSLIHYCLVLDFGRAALAVAPPAAAATAAGDAATGSGTGLKKRELRRIPVVVYEAKPGASATDDCVICLGEFDDGERVRVLPVCHHGFHVQCIDMWLAAHPSCPTCRNSLLIQQQGGQAGDGDGEATATAAGEET